MKITPDGVVAHRALARKAPRQTNDGEKPGEGFEDPTIKIEHNINRHNPSGSNAGFDHAQRYHHPEAKDFLHTVIAQENERKTV